MLLETHKLLTTFKELIPFKSTVTLSLSEKNLVIQVLFKKEETPYYYLQEHTLEQLNSYDKLHFVNDFCDHLQEFYRNAKKEDCQTSKLFNQTVDWKGENNCDEL